MAEQNFRSYRSHDPQMRGGDRYAPSIPGQDDDPLAELARLIGQSDPVDEYAPDARGAAAAYEPAEAASDWSADDRYAQAPTETYAENDPAASDFDPRYDGRLAARDDYNQHAHDQPYDQHVHAPPDYQHEEHDPQPRVADLPPPPAREATYEPPATALVPPRMNSALDEPRAFPLAPNPSPSRSERTPTAMSAKPLPAFLPRDDRYQYDEHEDADDQSYDTEDYEDEAPQGRSRSGLVIIAAVLGLVVLGTAGAFAYRTMFGGSMLPSLPPIIKADTGPNKIIPNASSTQGSAQASASSGSGEKLVSREEKPVDVPAPVNNAPRVISTIPVFPSPDSSSGAAPVMPTPAAPQPMSPSAAALPSAATAVPGAPIGTPEPKKIHTVAIRPDQLGGGPGASAVNSMSVPAQMPAPAAAVAPPARVSTPANPPRPAAPPPQAAQPAPQRSSANAPLSIVPSQGDGPAAQAPARTRTAIAQPTSINPAAPAPAAAAPSAGGGYNVQVTSQRSEADAQTAFRALSAKYPAQLGNQQPIVRRADLGDKGVFYRALVGPYASMEQAAGVCSSLKAAGGTCIVQRN
jgi:hypothetical protein